MRGLEGSRLTADPELTPSCLDTCSASPHFLPQEPVHGTPSLKAPL